MKIYITIFAAIILNIVFLFLIIRWYTNKMQIQYHKLLNKMDELLSGKKIEILHDESLDSAIFERLNRIIKITRIQKENAEEEMDIIKSLITNISHQIRTPLANITLYSDLLKERVKNSEFDRLTEIIEDNARKLEFFMKELIKSSYAEQGIISVRPKIVDLDTLLKKSCQTVELDAMKKTIKLVLDYSVCEVYADTKWTEEIFTNIIENAIKYSPKGATVTIKSILYDSFVCVQIIDNGIGIPEEEQGKIFQRFYRGTNTTDKQGFGIGLYLAREVLKKQQGYIKVKSTLDVGTTVEVFLALGRI